MHKEDCPKLSLHEIDFSSRQHQERFFVPGKLERVGLAQFNYPGGRIAQNTAAIIGTLEEGRRKSVDLLVFPELCIPGYCSMDLAYNREFLQSNREGLHRVIENSKGIAAVVGFIDEDKERTAPGGGPWIYNAAAYIHDGRLLHIQHKELLPNYGVFNEKRYFQSGSVRSILELEDGYRIGIAICEDLWADDNRKDIVGDLKDLGANFIVSINASPYHEGQLARRMEVLASAARNHEVRLAYTNNVGTFDTYDGELVFDGRSVLMAENGSCIGLAEAYKETLKVIDLDRPEPVLQDWKDSIIDVHDALIVGIRQFFSRKGLTTAFIGLSGGIDSAVVAALSVEALGADNVVGVTMPSHITSKETKTDAFKLADNLGIRCIERPITDEYDAWLQQFMNLKKQPPASHTRQNKQARIRHAILMEHTNEHPGSVILNTGNKTEIALGFFTLGGDSGGALAVIGDLDKGLVYALGDFINKAARKDLIPSTTISRAPTPELEPGQTDEGTLPAPYKVLVPLVNAIIEDLTPRDVLINTYGVEVVDATLALIRNSEGKRRQLPPAIRISKRSFGMERRIPMDHTF